MTTDLYMAHASDELDLVIRKFLQYGVSTAPVLDHSGEVIGMVTELALVKAFIRQGLKDLKVVRVGHFSEEFVEASFVTQNMPIAGVIKALINAPTHRVVVQSLGKNVVGIISPKDIMRLLLGEHDETKNLHLQVAEANDKLVQVISELKNTQDVLNKYQSLYEKTPIMMHSVNAEGKIIMANACIHKKLGYDPGELIGRHLTDLYAKSCLHEAKHGLTEIMNNGFHNNTYTTMLTKDGKKLRVDIASSAMRTPDGQFFGTISVSRPINSDNLLRALHGMLNQEKLDEEDLEEFLREIGESTVDEPSIQVQEALKKNA